MPTKQSSGDRGPGGPRFLSIADVAEILATSQAQVRALLRDRELRYIQIGGRNQYRIEVAELENYIQRQYQKADRPSTDQASDQASDRPEQAPSESQDG